MINKAFPPRVNISNGEIFYFYPEPNSLAYGEYLSLEEHQAILAATSQDVLKSKTVLDLVTGLEQIDDWSDDPDAVTIARETLSRYRSELEKLNKARAGEK